MTCNRHGELAPEDVYTRPEGNQECRLCQREQMKRYRRKKGRRTYKRHLALVRGESLPLAATAPRQTKRRSDARLSRSQVAAAYALYKSGWETREIADRGWQKWGYASPFRAKQQLERAFRLDGLVSRKSAQKCAGCGCDWDTRSRGCDSCVQRHASRKADGRMFVPGVRRDTCAGCGCALDERSRGCARCASRHWARQNKKAARLSELERRAA